MSPQDDIFFKSEGDQWFKRNETALATPDHLAKDEPLRMIESVSLMPHRVLEIGCSNGWRLAAVKARYNAACVGIDPSQEAITRGAATFPGIDLRRGLASNLPINAGDRFDLVIVSFVLHWVSRDTLLRTIAEVDRTVAPGGHLLIADFLPDHPVQNRYHHLPDHPVFTFKMNYPAIFLATGLYEAINHRIFHHAGAAVEEIKSDDRCGCTLLKKSMAI